MERREEMEGEGISRTVNLTGYVLVESKEAEPGSVFREEGNRRGLDGCVAKGRWGERERSAVRLRVFAWLVERDLMFLRGC